MEDTQPEPEKVPVIFYPDGDTPTCQDCDGPTMRTGTCHTCLVCGSTTGCG